MTVVAKRILVALLMALGLASPALAERKVALLIGNSAYAAVPVLRNPSNDVALMARTLRDAGFDTVETGLDLDERGMRQALRRFEDKVAEADVAVVFYSGHGVEMNGQNYLVPVDARLAADSDVKYEAVPLDRILEAIDRAKRLKLVILDACRDNPFFASMQRTMVQRSVGRGFARVELAVTGTLIAYAAKAGTTAADGNGANSPYTIALAKHVAKPGVDIRLALGTVRDEVLAATGQKQEPFVYGSLGGSLLTLGPSEPPKPEPSASVQAPAPVLVDPATARDACGYAGAHWAQAEKVDRLEFYEEHVRLFPNCPFAGFARLTIAEKKGGSAQQVAALPPAAGPPSRVLAEGDLTRSVQRELQRVGCYPGKVDGAWTAATRSALSRFNTFAKAALDTKAASAEVLDALRGQVDRVCPLTCARGTSARGDRCVPVRCGSGQQLSQAGACVAAPKAASKPAPEARTDPAVPAQPAAEQPSSAGAPALYDSLQPGMSCSLFGIPTLATGATGTHAKYWCK